MATGERFYDLGLVALGGANHTKITCNAARVRRYH